MVGIGRKAGLVSVGSLPSEEAVKNGSAVLLVLASDASDNTKKKFENMCRFYQVTFCYYGTKEALGTALGKAELSVAAVLDTGIAGKIRDYLNTGGILNGKS